MTKTNPEVQIHIDFEAIAGNLTTTAFVVL